jgi:hypothetical protein
MHEHWRGFAGDSPRCTATFLATGPLEDPPDTPSAPGAARDPELPVWAVWWGALGFTVAAWALAIVALCVAWRWAS